MTRAAFRLEVLPEPVWADAVAAALAARLRARPDARLCLPTGDTPSPVYAALAEAEAHGELSFSAATVVLLDEYVGLPASDPARCAGRLERELVGRLREPPAAFVTIDDNGDPDDAVARLDTAATRLDLAVLGLGANGHVGLNEPGSGPDAPTRLVRLAVSSREAATSRYGAAASPTAGITIGMTRLLGAREIWLLVTGERKSAILRRALEQPEGPDCPASYLRRHPRLVVFADEPAAARLSG